MKALILTRHLSGLFKSVPLLIFLLVSQRSAAQTPTITSFSPISGDLGETVILTGTNFNPIAANNIVFFGATRAAVTVAGATSLSVTVPAGAVHAPISVLNTASARIAYSQAYFRPMSSPKRAFAAADLATQIDLTTGSSPISSAMGDIDGDGLPDLVVANQTSNTVSIFHNTGSTGNIAFASKLDLPTGAGPRHVAIGDIDGDGLPDLAVAANGVNEVTILLNTSTVDNVSFASGVAVATVATPEWVSFSDVDADGMSDLLVASSSTNTVSVLRNTSSLGVVNLTSSVDIATGFQNYSVAAGDLDGDGLPDIVVGRNGGGITISRNTSTPGVPSFALVQNFTAGAGGRSIIMADIDGDGNLDVMAANTLASTISALRNISELGSIDFSANVPIATGAQNYSVAAGDLDADGRIDLVVGRQAGGNIALLLNTGSSGTISFSPALTITTAGGVQTIAVGDLDSDGVPDIAMSRASGNTLSVFRNMPVAPFVTSITPSNAAVGTSVTITGDHFNTVAQNNIVYFGATKATVTAASATSITINAPVGSTHAPVTVLNAATDLSAASPIKFSPVFSPVKGNILSDDFAARVSYATGNNATWSAAGDLDGDGKADIAVTYASKVAVFLNTGNTGTIGMAAAVEFTTNSTARSVSIGDIDGDGKPDLAVTNYFSSNVSIFRNTSTPGNLSFVKTDVAAGLNPFHVIIADLDNDGKPDLAVTNESANTISVLRNTGIAGAISFAGAVAYPTGSNPRIATIADLDGDGKADIAVANMNSNNVTVLLNTSPSGSITFAPGVNFIAGTEPWAVDAGDLDGDGKIDLAVVNFGSGNMSVLLNSGTIGVIGFSAKTDFPSSTAPSGIAIADIDADGKADVAVSTYSGFISAFHNRSTVGTAAFASSVNYPAGNSAVNVVIADFDGDGRLDLESPNESINTMSILRNAPPVISTTGTLIAVNTTYGTASAPTSFSISGTEIVSGITITPPAGFELSQTAGGASGYAGSGTAITMAGAGTIASKTIYVRLTAATPAGAYSGNIVSSSGSASVNTATVLSTVSPAMLTVRPADALRTYQGPVLTGAAGSTTFTSTGLQNSETIGSVTVGYTAGAGNGNVATDGAGTYTGSVIATAATGGTFSPANYTISYLPGDLVVNKAALTITAANVARIYGSVLTGASGSTTFSSSGLLDSETIGSVTLTYAGSGNNATDAIGTYNDAIIPSAATGGTFSAANYDITYLPGNLSVTTAPLTITAGNATRSYGSVLTGTAGPTAFTSSGLQNSETIGSVTLAYAASGNNATDASGTYNGAIIVSAATGGTFSAANYAITYVPGNLSVTTAPLTITAGNATRSYGSVLTGTAGSTAFTSSGLQNSETIGSVILAYAASGNNATDASGTYNGAIIPSAATGGTFSAANYDITYLPGNLSVTTAPLTITAGNATRSYGSVLTGTAGSTAFTSSGLQNSETIGSVTLAYTASGNNATDAAGTYNAAVIASAATGGTFSAANYAITYTSGSITVNAAPLKVTAVNATRMYGTTNPAFTASFTGFVNGDTEASLATQPTFNTPATISSPAGAYPITPSGVSSPNYTITYIDGILTVLPAANIAPTFPAIASQSVCYSPALQSITISGITAGGESGQTVILAVSSDGNLFSSISISPVVNGSATISYVLGPGASGTAQVTVTATDDGGTLNGGADTFSRTFPISVNALPVTAISDDVTISKGAVATLTASGGTTYQWSNSGGIVSGQNTAVLTVRPFVTTSYTVTVSNASGCTVLRTATVIVMDDYKALDPLNAITPNGDGKNDTWVIGNIDAYPNNTVKVYDRAGRPVYSKKGYNNDWDGTYNGLPLQQDTYYFVVDFGTGGRLLKGFISIVR